MATNEERREIAARLRGIAARNQGSLGAKRMGEVLMTAQEVTVTRGLPSVTHVLERYADLIEPEPERTCRLVMIAPGWWECDECAQGIDWDSCSERDPPSCSYCPNCGAKVVADDL